MNIKYTRVYGKLESDLRKLGIKDVNKYVKLVEDFSEVMKRIECTFEALTSRFALESIISINDSLGIESDYFRNVNWIYLSYSCTEFTNLFHGETNGFPKLYEKLLNSLVENKFPSYLGIFIDKEVIKENQKSFQKIETFFSSEIKKIKIGRDKSFSHVDKNQNIDLPSTQIMIRIVNQLNNVFLDLYKILELKAVENKQYVIKEGPKIFSSEQIGSKIKFFLSYMLRERKDVNLITKKVLETLLPSLDNLLGETIQ